jgi:DNA-binding CsgD family transcriptional regulator
LHKVKRHGFYVEGGVHLDEICCWCGLESCRDYRYFKRDGHGPHADGLVTNKRYSRAAKTVLEMYRKAKKPDRIDLKLVEIDIIRMLVAGETKFEIEDRVGMKRHTLTTRLKRMREKYGAKTDIHLIAMTMKAGII